MFLLAFWGLNLNLCVILPLLSPVVCLTSLVIKKYTGGKPFEYDKCVSCSQNGNFTLETYEIISQTST